MQSLSDIAKIKDKDERRRAMEERQRARKEAERNDPLREVKESLRARIAGCPTFLLYAIAPIPNFLQGTVPPDGFMARAVEVLKIWDFGKPEVLEILKESYMQEVDLVLSIIRACGSKNLEDEAQLEAFKQEVKVAFDAYMALPPMERKHYIL